jgi:hypothetical protein
MYLPSFYKLQFEKYMFNVKRAGMFAIPVVLWSIFLLILQSDGPSTPTSTTPSTLTSSHPPEESREEHDKNNNDFISFIIRLIYTFIHLHLTTSPFNNLYPYIDQSTYSPLFSYQFIHLSIIHYSQKHTTTTDEV